jgi:hypothetical protein
VAKPAAQLLGRLRALAWLPGVAVEVHERHAAFVIRKRNFAWFLDDHHGDGIIALSLKVPPGENQAMMAAQPERFVLPSYIASRGWVSIRLDVPQADWDEVGELLTDRCLMTAPKTLVKRCRSLHRLSLLSAALLSRRQRLLGHFVRLGFLHPLRVRLPVMPADRRPDRPSLGHLDGCPARLAFSHNKPPVVPWHWEVAFNIRPRGDKLG